MGGWVVKNSSLIVKWLHDLVVGIASLTVE